VATSAPAEVATVASALRNVARGAFDVRGRGDELDGIAGHRIALDTADMDADALAWWTPRLHEKYRQANATVGWQLLRGDRELTRSGRYVIDITGTWTIADTTQNTDERLVEVDWSPSRSGARRSSLTVRQGLRGADGLAAWNERFTTGVEYEHDELWGA